MSKGDNDLSPDPDQAVCLQCRGVGALGHPAQSKHSHILRTEWQSPPCQWRGDTHVPH